MTYNMDTEPNLGAKQMSDAEAAPGHYILS